MTVIASLSIWKQHPVSQQCIDHTTWYSLVGQVESLLKHYSSSLTKWVFLSPSNAIQLKAIGREDEWWIIQSSQVPLYLILRVFSGTRSRNSLEWFEGCVHLQSISKCSRSFIWYLVALETGKDTQVCILHMTLYEQCTQYNTCIMQCCLHK